MMTIRRELEKIMAIGMMIAAQIFLTIWLLF